MTLPTHVILGIIIGKITGDYPTAVLSSTLIDSDHLYSYVKSGVVKNPNKFLKTIMSEDDPYGNQRGFLHNVIVCSLISLGCLILLGQTGIVIIAGYLSHLCLDALDNSDYWPFYPNKSVNLKGFIHYGTWQEIIFAFTLLVAWFFI